MSGRVVSGFVGRQEELRELLACLDRARAGSGAMVVLSGDGGIGKTRLCQELAVAADDLGVGVAWAVCPESGGMPAFWPWWQLLDQLGAPIAPMSAGEDAPDVARARLFAWVIDAVRVAALLRPRLLVLDDVQWADTGTLRLLDHVGRLLRRVDVLLIVTLRQSDAAPSPLASGLLSGAHSMRLAGLRVNELADLVEDLTGSRSEPEVSEALHRTTAGNPLFAAELVRRLHREGRLDLLATTDEVPISPTVRAVLGEQLADLSDSCREVLAVSAVVGGEFPIGLLADVAGRDRLDVLAMIEEAAAGGVVVAAGVGRFAFTHPMLRSVMYDDIGVARRVRLHHRIAEALEAEMAAGREVDLAALSFHWLNAAPGGTAGKAVHYAERAAQAAMARLGYEDAVKLYDWALTAYELDASGSERGPLLLGAGAARAAIGDADGARVMFLAAADHARRYARWADLAAAALGLAGTGFEVALFDEEQIGLLEEALDVVGDGQPGLRSRVSSRLSVALSLGGRDRRRAALSESAVRLAQVAGDVAALADALAARCDAHAGPAHVAQRASDAAEILRIAHSRGDPGRELLGRRLLLVASLEVGDVRAVDAQIHAFAQLAERLGHPQYRWYVPLWRAMRAVMRGRLAEQQALAVDAQQLGHAAGSVNVDILLLTHRWFALLEAGDVRSALSHLELVMPPGAYTELGPQMIPAAVIPRLLAGSPDEARAVLDRAAEDLRSADRDSEWLTMQAQVAEACFRLGGHELVPWIYRQLSPFADLWAVDGIGAYAHGPVHRYLGLLAVLLGRPEEASAHFDAALAGNRRAGADLLVARTLLDRGVALGEPPALRAARDAYAQLGVARRVLEIDALLGATPDTDRRGAGKNEFRQVGDVWTLAFDGHRCSVRDSKGIRDLARLLAQPGREIAALDLAAAVGAPRLGGDLGEIIDAQARAAYKARLVQLQAELEAADDAGDNERSSRAHAERDALLAQLSTAYGLAGHPRRSGDPAERARTAVTARIRDAIRRVTAHHPALGHHLNHAVRTGTLCCYDPDQPTPWQL